MTTREEIEKQLTAARVELEQELYVAVDAARSEAENVKRIRAALDALPRLAVKRTRRPKAPRVTVDGLTKVLTALGESLLDDSVDDGLRVTTIEREAHAAEREFES